MKSVVLDLLKHYLQVEMQFQQGKCNNVTFIIEHNSQVLEVKPMIFFSIGKHNSSFTITDKRLKKNVL